MRGYQCTFHVFLNDKLVLCTNQSCWAGINLPRVYLHHKVEILWGNDIYISQFNEPETKKYQRRLFHIINKITPCKVVTIQNEKYIEFRLMNFTNHDDSYNRNLIILNFIRNLWYEPVKGYTRKFFEALRKSKHLSDPIERLTWANKEAVTEKTVYVLGHCNVHKKNILKIKTLKDFFDQKKVILSTKDFLVT